MSVKTGEVVTVDFTTHTPSTGAATDADSTPTGTLVINGTDNGATVTVTNKATGIYKAAVTLPTIAAGDEVQIRIAATVGGITGNAVVWTDSGTAATTDDVAALIAALNDYDGSDTAGTTTLLSRIVGSGDTITCHRGDELTVAFSGLGSIAGRLALWITAKRDRMQTDAQALIQCTESAGLVVLNGATATKASDGDITVTDEDAGDLTWTVKAEATALLTRLERGAYDVQWKDSDGDVHTLTDGTFKVSLDVTMATEI